MIGVGIPIRLRCRNNVLIRAQAVLLLQVRLTSEGASVGLAHSWRPHVALQVLRLAQALLYLRLLLLGHVPMLSLLYNLAI